VSVMAPAEVCVEEYDAAGGCAHDAWIVGETGYRSLVRWHVRVGSLSAGWDCCKREEN